MITIIKKHRGAWGILALTGLLAIGCGSGESPAPGEPAAPDAPEAAMPSPDAVPQPVGDPGMPVTPAEMPGDQEVAATVNGVPIMVSEVRAMFDQRFAQYLHQAPPEQLEAFWQAQMPVMLEMAVGQHLIKQEIAQRGIDVSEDAIDAKLAEFNEQIPPGQTIEQLTGQTTEEIRNAVREMLKYEELLEIHELSVSEPGDEEVQAYYDEHIEDFQMPETVQARHILLSVGADDDEETRAAKRAKIEEIRAQLIAQDADFAELAEAHSDCPSRQRGGDLGSFGRGQMVPPFEEAAFSQAPGVVGEVVETDFGYHLIEVIDTQEARQAPMDEVRDHISGRIQEQAHRRQQDALLKKLRANVDIEYLIP